MREKFFRASILQALLWLILPLMVILVVVAVGALTLHEQVMRQYLPEEAWHAATNPVLELTLIAPLVLVVPLLFSGAALWFGARQIVRPLQVLEKQAAALAWGDFETIQQPVGGILEIQSLHRELVEMARKMQAAQEGLRDYISAITTAQEEERRRLARELHDDTIQALIALKHRMQLAEKTLRDPSGRKALQDLEALAEQTIENLRRLTRALRPIYLEDLGLVTALEMLAREVEQASGVRVLFQQIGLEKRLDPRVELALYRIAQEALNNVVRHSRAHQVQVLIRFDDQVVLEVRDDGIGFLLPSSPTDFATRGHFGLLGMRERAELIGARLEVESAPGTGTRVRVRV